MSAGVHAVVPAIVNAGEGCPWRTDCPEHFSFLFVKVSTASRTQANGDDPEAGVQLAVDT